MFIDAGIGIGRIREGALSLPGPNPARGRAGRRGRPRSPESPSRQPPMPLPDGRCNPLCPYFRCLNNALAITRRHHHGRVQRVAFCRWIGDVCIGGSCQYASCKLRALLPDGKCLYAVEKKERAESDLKELEEEVRREEIEMGKIDRLMRRRGYSLEDEF